MAVREQAMTFTILDNGLSIKEGMLRYAWFRIQNHGEPFYRCVALRELKVIPVSERKDYDLLGKQWGAMRGLHNAGVNFVYAAMGIYDPAHVGIVQYFGAAGEGGTEESAAAKATIRGGTREGGAATFPQSQ